MEILSAKEWMNYKYENINANIRSTMDMQEYAKYLLEKQAEFIAEMCIGENLIKLASKEFIKKYDKSIAQ